MLSNTSSRLLMFLSLYLSAFSAAGPGLCGNPLVSGRGPAAQPYEAPEVAKISDRFYSVGDILLDSQQRCLYIPGHVNMSKGLVELLACGEKGKRHESVLVLEVAPEHIQVGLLLLGLEPIGGLRYQGDPGTPLGDSVWIWVEWDSGGDRKLVRGEDMITNYTTGGSMQRTHWIFSGSTVFEGRFAAAIEQSIVTTFHDPFTIIDNPLPTGADDTIYGANEQVVPEVGHPVILIVKADRTPPEHLDPHVLVPGKNGSRSDLDETTKD